jgi:hypothetical protein
LQKAAAGSIMKGNAAKWGPAEAATKRFIRCSKSCTMQYSGSYSFMEIVTTAAKAAPGHNVAREATGK